MPIGVQIEAKPSSDLRNHYTEISRECKEHKQAIIITVNGRSDLVVLSYDEYHKMAKRMELLELLVAAEDDARNKRVIPINTVFDRMMDLLKGMY